MRNLLSCGAAFLVLASCGPSDKQDNNIVVVNASPNNASPNNQAPNTTVVENNRTLDDRDQAIVDGFTAPSEAHDAAEAALTLTVESVVAASLAATQGEQLVTSGTLTQSGQQFSYAAGPSDRLVVKWAQGEPTEIFVSQFDGNFEAETVEEFFGDDHVVAARIVRDGSADFEVGSQKTGGTRTGGIQGTIIESGIAYEVDVEETGTTTSSAEISSIEYESESTMSGTITAPGLELVAEETYYYHHVYVDRAIENQSRTANSRWTVNGKAYAVNDVLIRTAFAETYPDEFDYWRVEGTVTEDGVVVGQMNYEETETHIDVFLELASGERLVLQRHTKYVQ